MDRAAIGRGFQVLLRVELTAQDRAGIEAFEAQVERIDEIVA